MDIWRDFVVCPYNKNHVIRKCNVPTHVPTCKEKHQNIFFLTCRFNCQRLCEEDLEFSCQGAPDIVSSKSKRRRYRIKQRRNTKPRSNKPVKSDSMDKKQDVKGGQGGWETASEIWVECLRKTTQKKNPVSTSYDKAGTSDAEHRSKTAKKRTQKKRKKEKDVPADVADVPADKSSKKKEYVIKLNESVSVTETNKSRKEVYIHYPTRKILPPDSVPNSGLEIKPMMLQTICFEAFMKMQSSSDKEENRVSSSANENESITVQGSGETASGVTPSANEDVNKTTQVSSETARGVTPSRVKNEKKTTQASVGTLNADVYYPKRYKPKKDKKKHRANPKSTRPPNVAKPSPPKEVPLQERFAKYMISESDGLHQYKPHPNKKSFPPPYLGDSEVSEESEEDRGDYGICQYLFADEWADEKDP